MFERMWRGNTRGNTQDPRQKRFRNSPDVQPGRYCPCWRVIIRPRRLCTDSCANGPQLQGVSAEVLAKAGTSALTPTTGDHFSLQLDNIYLNRG